MSGTWDHPRGYRALEAAVRDAGKSGLCWMTRNFLYDRHHVPGAET